MKNLDTNAYYALGIPVILLVVLVELVAQYRGRRVFGFAETISNFSSGLGTMVVGLFLGPLVYALYDYTHAHFALVAWHGSPWRWPVALAVSDLSYYLWHRASHACGILWTIHGVHHQHEHMNSSVGLRLEWLADLANCGFFALLPLLGIDPPTGFVAIAVLSAYTLTTHSPVFRYPTLGGLLVTSATHGSHHSRDARFSGRNFGALLTVWDRLLGTYREPVADRAALRSDVPTVARCHDSVRAQWSLLVELGRQVARAGSWRAALALVVGPPVLDPALVVETPRDDRELSASLRAFILVNFLVVAALGAAILLARDGLPRSLQVLGALSVLWGLRSIGGLLDGRKGALREDAVRLAVLAGLAVFAPWVAPR